MQEELEKYVKENLKSDLRQIESSNRGIYDLPITKYERAIIHKYSDDGYESLNELLRNGNEITKFGNFLNHSLEKLDNYEGLCYRSIKCSKTSLNKYYESFRNAKIIKEPSFLSCSKSKTLALYFSTSPLFIIKSKNGKDIEKIAKFGIDDFGQNEKEILFKNNSMFRVLDINENSDRITITLEEV